MIETVQDNERKGRSFESEIIRIESRRSHFSQLSLSQEIQEDVIRRYLETFKWQEPGYISINGKQFSYKDGCISEFNDDLPTTLIAEQHDPFRLWGYFIARIELSGRLSSLQATWGPLAARYCQWGLDETGKEIEVIDSWVS